MGKEPKASETVRQFLREVGRKGGLARAAKHDKKALSRWGKLGGRPPKKGKRDAD